MGPATRAAARKSLHRPRIPIPRRCRGPAYGGGLHGGAGARVRGREPSTDRRLLRMSGVCHDLLQERDAPAAVARRPLLRGQGAGTIPPQRTEAPLLGGSLARAARNRACATRGDAPRPHAAPAREVHISRIRGPHQAPAGGLGGGAYICTRSTLLWTPFSPVCRACAMAVQCRTLEQRRYPELLRIREEQYGKGGGR